MATVSHEYLEGGTIRLKADLSNPETGATVEPAIVVFTVRKPNGDELTPAVSHTPGTGVYTSDITPADGEAGTWKYRVDTTGPGGSAKASVVVKARALA